MVLAFALDAGSPARRALAARVVFAGILVADRRIPRGRTRFLFPVPA